VFLRVLTSAVNALLRHRMRTLLTTLGISIGIAAVISTVALGEGSAAEVERQLDNLGDDFIWIESGSYTAAGARSGSRGARSLVPEDATALVEQVPEVRMCSPQFDGREQIIVGNQNWNTRYVGAAPEIFAIRRWILLSGTFFTAFDLERRTRVVVIGQAVAERLFELEDPVGQTIRIGRVPFQVLGVLEAKGTSSGGVDRDDVAFMPFTTAQRYFYDREWVDDIYCSIADPALMDRAEFQVSSVLRIRHGIEEGEEDDFGIRRPEEWIALRAEASQTMALMLTAIASVSLVVGGVGIMNIMLVSVTERTREIGLRLAVGARMRDIRIQFLAEAAMLGAIGGVLGLALGWVGSAVMTERLGWAMVISSEAVTLAVAVAVGASLVFGYFPAHRASSLDPVEALRSEA
jgi:putative ABC transport system permease protein